MSKNKSITFILLLLMASTAFAQKEERDYIRKGNRAFKDSTFINAEVNYRKALDINPRSTISMYNLGNALVFQQKAQDAMKQYEAAAKIEKDKGKLAKIHHNAGVLHHVTRDYAKAIEAYKESLRNNPADDETRYNLALAQKMQDEQPQDQQQEQDKQDQQDKEEQQDQQDQDKNNQDQNQDQQPPEEKENEMSKESAEQMLNLLMQDEKEVQEKVKKQQQAVQSGRLEKDW